MKSAAEAEKDKETGISTEAIRLRRSGKGMVILIIIISSEFVVTETRTQ